MERIRTVIIGCGDYGRHCLPGIYGHEAFEIVCVVDPNEANRRAAAELAGVGDDARFASAAPAFEAFEADFAFVFSKVDAHFENCLAALDAGCHVSVAKPFVHKLSAGVELVKVAEDKGLWLSVGQSVRFSPQARAMKQLIDEGRLGVPAFGNMHMYRDRTASLQDYQIHEDWPAINATAIHNFDLLRYLFDGRIARVCFRGIDVQWSPYDDPAVVTGWLEMDNGMVVSYFHSFVNRIQCSDRHPCQHAMVQGSKGALVWGGPGWGGPVTFHDAEKRAVGELPLADRDLAAQVWDYSQWLYESLHRGRCVFCDAQDNLWSLAAIKSAELSARNGGTIVEVMDVARAEGMA